MKTRLALLLALGILSAAVFDALACEGTIPCEGGTCPCSWSCDLMYYYGDCDYTLDYCCPPMLA